MEKREQEGDRHEQTVTETAGNKDAASETCAVELKEQEQEPEPEPEQLTEDDTISMINRGISIEIIPVESNCEKATIGIQANDYEIERRGVLPARKRIIPFKFRDFHDPDELPAEDSADVDYNPSVPTKSRLIRSGRGRGRPKKEHAYGLPADSGDPAEIKTEGRTDPAEGAAVLVHAVVSRRGRPPSSSNKQLPKTFRCQKCGKMFSQKGNLKVHMMYHNDERPHHCDVPNCNKGFRTKENLRRHKMAHAGIKQFECQFCTEKFSSQVAAKEHMSRHTNSKDYKCLVCGQQFRQISCLRRHLTRHNDQKPHVCNICGDKFSQMVYLRSHMRRHTGERPFPCTTCLKAFAHMSDLNRHKSVHTGEKKHVCDVCGAKFSDPSSKRRHVKEHNGYKPYTCHLCGSTFKRGGNLKSHLAKKHMKSLDIIISKSDKSKDVVKIASQDDLLQLGVLNIEPESQQLTLQEVHALQTQLVAVSENKSDADGLTTAEAQPTADPPQDHVLNLQTQKILERIHTEFGSITEAAVDSEGRPLQVAYHIIHDDEEQQIVEIQYQPFEQTDEGEAVQVVHSDEQLGQAEEKELEEPTEEEEEAQEQEPAPIVVVQSADEAGQNEGLTLEETVECSQMDVDVVEGESSEEDAVGQTEAPVDENNSYEHVQEVVSEQVDPDGSSPLITGQESGVNIIKSVIVKQEAEHKAECHYPQTTEIIDYVQNPDFASQAYYNWLSSFTEVCKIMVLPLDTEIFHKISQVQKTLSDVLAAPTGILTNSTNFKILMNISKELNSITNEHLAHVLEQLEEN